MSDCPICIEKYNRSTRTKISCQYCQYEACRSCCQTYLLQEVVPKCMNNECTREWTRQFIVASFTKTFVANEYKTHCSEILFERERGLMPATQHIIEGLIRREQLQDEILALQAEAQRIQNRIYRLTTERNMIGVTGAGYQPNEHASSFVRACSADGCRGFLSTQWKCGLCENWTCSQCHELKGPDRNGEHTCNPDNVATAQMIARETKPCPKCAIGIFKIDGCNQMFCTACNTAFDWRTGRILLRDIHNPHYFEYMQRHGTAPPAIVEANRCGERNINHVFSSTIYSQLNEKRREHQIVCDCQQCDWITRNKSRILEICRNNSHLRTIEMPRYNHYNILTVNETLRVRYMRNMLTDERFKSLLVQNDKKNQKQREIYNVLDMVVTTTRDIMMRLSEQLKHNNWYANTPDTLNEVDGILDYANECFLEIATTYGSIKMKIGSQLNLY